MFKSLETCYKQLLQHLGIMLYFVKSVIGHNQFNWFSWILVCINREGYLYAGSNPRLGINGSTIKCDATKHKGTCFVPNLDTQPSRLQMRWTWVSTQIPWTLFHATFITYYATNKIRFRKNSCNILLVS